MYKKPIYFLTDLWDTSIKSNICPELNHNGSIYRFRAYGKTVEGHYIGHIERSVIVKGQGLVVADRCLYAEFPSAVWDENKSLHAILLQIVNVNFECKSDEYQHPIYRVIKSLSPPDETAEWVVKTALETDDIMGYAMDFIGKEYTTDLAQYFEDATMRLSSNKTSNLEITYEELSNWGTQYGVEFSPEDTSHPLVLKIYGSTNEHNL